MGRRAPRPVASCFGGGAAFGIGFNMGVARALIDQGIPVADGPMLGSSAGAWTAASLVTDVSFDAIMQAFEEKPRRDRPVRVIEITEPLFGDRMDERVTGVAIHVPSGIRVRLAGAKHSLADIVAASSSPPQLARPHRIGSNRYIDPTLRTTSADRAKSARVLVLLAPMAGPVFRSYGRINEQFAHYEISRWRARTGGVVLYVRPTKAIADRVAGGRDDLLNVAIARRTYDAAYELGGRCAERFRSRHPDVADELFSLPDRPIPAHANGAK
jgi:NTE family protein